MPSHTPSLTAHSACRSRREGAKGEAEDGRQAPHQEARREPAEHVRHARALEQQVHEQFAVLGTTRGFATLPPARSVITTTFYFTHHSLGFEIALDFRDETVYVYLVRLQDGQVPRGGYIVDGEVVRLPLRFVLRDLLQVADERLDALDALLRARSPLDYEGAVEAVKRWREIIEHRIDLIEQTPITCALPSGRHDLSAHEYRVAWSAHSRCGLRLEWLPCRE